MPAAPRHTLDQLLVLETIARTGTFVAAARELHRVPSAVSYAVAGLESALECGFTDYHTVLEECAKLLEARMLITQGKAERPKHKAMVERYTQTYRDAHVRTVFHDGRKHVLRHRIEIPSENNPLTLRMHYAWDQAADRYVIGWFDEFLDCPF